MVLLKNPFFLNFFPSLFLKVLGIVFSFRSPKVSTTRYDFLPEITLAMLKIGSKIWWQTHTKKKITNTHHYKINKFIASHSILNQNPSYCNDGSLNTVCPLRRGSFFQKFPVVTLDMKNTSKYYIKPYYALYVCSVPAR